MSWRSQVEFTADESPRNGLRMSVSINEGGVTKVSLHNYRNNIVRRSTNSTAKYETEGENLALQSLVEKQMHRLLLRTVLSCSNDYLFTHIFCFFFMRYVIKTKNRIV